MSSHQPKRSDGRPCSLDLCCKINWVCIFYTTGHNDLPLGDPFTTFSDQICDHTAYRPRIPYLFQSGTGALNSPPNNTPNKSDHQKINITGCGTTNIDGRRTGWRRTLDMTCQIHQPVLNYKICRFCFSYSLGQAVCNIIDNRVMSPFPTFSDQICEPLS